MNHRNHLPCIQVAAGVSEMNNELLSELKASAVNVVL